MSITRGKIDSAVGNLNDHGEILQRCLEAIERGQATVESCVVHYPEFTNLEDLLRAATFLRALPLATLAEPSRSEIRQRILEKYRARQPVPAPVRQPRFAWGLRFALPLLMVVLLMFGSGAMLVRASDAAVPGDGLYGLKRTVERVELSLAAPGSRPGLLYQDAQNRLAEISILSLRHEVIADMVLADMVLAVNTALAAQPDPSTQERLLEQTSAVLDHAQALGAIDDTARAGTMAMLAPVQNPAGQMPDKPQPTDTETATQTPTATSTASSTATQTPTATLTETATDEPTASETATQTDDPSVTPTDEPISTPTDEPTDSPTDTPKLGPGYAATVDPTAATQPGSKPTNTPKPKSSGNPNPGVPQGNANGNANPNPNSNGNPNPNGGKKK